MEYPKNQAVVFIKPNAANGDTETLVKTMFKTCGIEIIHDTLIQPHAIRERIDGHYGAISSRAMTQPPANLVLPDLALEDFCYKFGLLWADAIANGWVKNAADASKDWGLDVDAMEIAWRQAERENRVLKIGSGLYLGRIASDKFVINGFYLRMRERYTQATTSMPFYIVSWSSKTLSWEQFREHLIGCTDPSKATDGSLRAIIYQRWQELGLETQPNTGDNAIHASASPLEALTEIENWRRGISCYNTILQFDVMFYLFTRSLIPMAKIQEWMGNAMVVYDGKPIAVFDLVENMDAPKMVDVLRYVG